MEADGDKPASTKKYIIVGIISYVAVALFLLAVVTVLSILHENTVKGTTEAVANLNVLQNEEAARQSDINVKKAEFFQNSLLSGRPAPIDEAQVALAWENGAIIKRTEAELNRLAVVATSNYIRPVSAPIGRVVEPALILGDPFPLTTVVVNEVYRFLKLSITISGVINFFEIVRGAALMPALAARIVSVTTPSYPPGTAVFDLTVSHIVTAADVVSTPMNLVPEPITGFSRAVPFHATGMIELEMPASAAGTRIATFGDVLQIIPVNFTHAQISSFKLAVAGENWGPVATVEVAAPPRLNDAEMYVLAA